MINMNSFKSTSWVANDEKLQSVATISLTHIILLSLNYNKCFISTMLMSMFQRMLSDAYKLMIRADKKPAGEHERRFQCTYDRRDIALEKENQLQRVAETHRSYEALQYARIFWAREVVYYFLIPQIDPTIGLPIDGKKYWL
jgi:hypothetical protein